MTLRRTSQVALLLVLVVLLGCAKARIVRHDDRPEPALAASSAGVLFEASRAALSGAPDGASAYAMLHENDEAPIPLSLDAERKLFWESSAGRSTSQPAKTFGERVGDFFYGLILPESQL